MKRRYNDNASVDQAVHLSWAVDGLSGRHSIRKTCFSFSTHSSLSTSLSPFEQRHPVSQLSHLPSGSRRTKIRSSDTTDARHTTFCPIGPDRPIRHCRTLHIPPLPTPRPCSRPLGRSNRVRSGRHRFPALEDTCEAGFRKGGNTLERG